MIKEIIQLLPEKQRKRGIWVAFSVLLRAILDFAGVAALIPILLVVAKQDGGRGMMLAEECFGSVSGTCAKPLPVGDIPGIQQADVCQLLPSRIAFPEREEQCATGT